MHAVSFKRPLALHSSSTTRLTFSSSLVSGQHHHDSCGTPRMYVLLLSFFLVRILTRRAILMGGSFLQSTYSPSNNSNASMCICVVGLVCTVWPNSPSAGKDLVAFVFMYSFVLAGTITPYAFVVGTEIPNQRLRAYTLTVLFAALLRCNLGGFVHSSVLYQSRH